MPGGGRQRLTYLENRQGGQRQNSIVGAGKHAERGQPGAQHDERADPVCGRAALPVRKPVGGKPGPMQGIRARAGHGEVGRAGQNVHSGCRGPRLRVGVVVSPGDERQYETGDRQSAADQQSGGHRRREHPAQRAGRDERRAAGRNQAAYHQVGDRVDLADRGREQRPTVPLPAGQRRVDPNPQIGQGT